MKWAELFENLSPAEARAEQNKARQQRQAVKNMTKGLEMLKQRAMKKAQQGDSSEIDALRQRAAKAFRAKTAGVNIDNLDDQTKQLVQVFKTVPPEVIGKFAEDLERIKAQSQLGAEGGNINNQVAVDRKLRANRGEEMKQYERSPQQAKQAMIDRKRKLRQLQARRKER